MVWGTPSSSTRKLSFLSPGMNMPSLLSTPTSMVTKGTLTVMVVSGIPSIFLGPWGLGSFFGSSVSFFLGMAMGPMSPWGPPASPVLLGLFCWFGLCCEPEGCCVWLCPRPAVVVSANPASTMMAKRFLNMTKAKELDFFIGQIKHILCCPFGRFYISIDARTHHFRRFLKIPPCSDIGHCRMKKALFVASSLLIFVSLSFAQSSNKPAQQKQPIMTVDEVRPGMKGIAYTVFEGAKPEPMDVEILGVLKNMNGPKSDLILVRLHGEKPEYTGVVAGMSGSPV